MAKRFYLTTPIYYVNDVPHVGTAYTTVAADVLARCHRLRGEDVLFATGADENAPKVAQAAAEQGRDPAAFVAGMAERFKHAWRELHVDYDAFIRTSEERHRRAVSHFVSTLLQRGDIYKGPYEGWYCISCETYFGADEAPATGDERLCPNVPEHPPLRLVQETNYFFALSRYGELLQRHIEEHPDFLQPDFRRNEVIAFIEAGLRDVCISRSNNGWGIPVPGDSSQVVYVWFDALINYLTVAGYPDEPEQMAARWPCDLHLVGKDIYVRFHCTLWPAMLMAAGLEPPRQVFGHGFWMSEGRRMSKSLRNFIEPLELADWLAAHSGAAKPVAVDALRYFLFREMSFGEDGNFARQALLQRFNSDLANDLGNALNRSLALCHQNFGPEVPPASPGEERLRPLAVEAHEAIGESIDRLDLQGALTRTWGFIGSINKYLDDRAPWSLARDGKREELASVLCEALEAVRVALVWTTPFMPMASAEMRRQLGLGPALHWDEASEWGILQPGARLEEPAPVFPRIPRKSMDEALKAASAESAPDAAAPPAPAPAETATIGIEDFAKLELRVAEILTAERVPKADRLLNLRVSLGDEERTVLAGLAQYYEPEQLAGRKVVMIVNLEPRKMRGIESQGMLLAAEAGEVVSLLQPDTDLPAGARVR